MVAKRLPQEFERNMKTQSGEESTEANRAVGAPQGYKTRRGWGEWGVSVPAGVWGYLEKGISDCGGAQCWCSDGIIH